MNKVGRNDLCPCGSNNKYKKCCMINNIIGGNDDDNYITDKFCVLWCCKDFFMKYTKDWSIKVLLETNLGSRYFTKIESLSKCITVILSDALNTSIYFADTENNHFGMVMEEDGPFCNSKFAKNYNGIVCVDGTCNNPNLTIYNKYIGALMCCVDCQDKDCVSKQSCKRLMKTILQIHKMIKNAKETSLEPILEKFFAKRYEELITRINLINKLPLFLE
jgi:hypothetical protein